MPRARSHALLGAAALSWAVSTVLTKDVLHELAPLDLLGIELASSAAFLVAVLGARGRPFLPRSWRGFVVLGALEPALSFALFDFGLEHTGAADGALLIASESLFAVAFARLVLGERIASRTAAVLALGFAGSVLIGLGEAGHGANLFGDLLVLGGSATAAGYSVGARPLTRDEDSLAATVTQLVAALFLASPLVAGGAVFGSSRLGSANAGYLLAAVATGLLGGALPFLAFNVAIREVTLASASLVLNLTPVLAAALAVLLLGERIGWSAAGGGLLVVLAAAGAGAAADAPQRGQSPAGNADETRFS